MTAVSGREPGHAGTPGTPGTPGISGNDQYHEDTQCRGNDRLGGGPGWRRPAGTGARLGRKRGRAAAPAIVLRSPRALRRILWRPGELGLARAYVSGDLDVDGDLTEALRRARRAFGAGRAGLEPMQWTKAVSGAALAARGSVSSDRRHRRQTVRSGTQDARTAGLGTEP